jgi:putative transposase
MIHLILTLAVALARALFGSRLELLAENLALRQQLAVFKHKRSRPRMGPGDRMFWVFLRSVWRNWSSALIIVEPDTVVQWHPPGIQIVLELDLQG